MKALLKGFDWTVTSSIVEDELPTLPQFAQRAKNSSNAVFKSQTELELCSEVLVAHQETGEECVGLAKRLALDPKLSNLAPILGEWCSKFAGRKDGPLLKFLQQMSIDFGSGTACGFEFWESVTKTNLGTSSSFPFVRASLLVANLTTQKVVDGCGRLCVAADVMKLKKVKELEELEDMLAKGREKVHSQLGSDADRYKMFGRLCLRCILFILKKKGRESQVWNSLDEIYQKFLEGLESGIRQALTHTESKASSPKPGGAVLDLVEASDPFLQTLKKIGDIKVGTLVKHSLHKSSLFEVASIGKDGLELAYAGFWEQGQDNIKVTKKDIVLVSLYSKPKPFQIEDSVVEDLFPTYNLVHVQKRCQVWLSLFDLYNE